MAKVRILETFEVVKQLGPLVVHEPRTGLEEVIDASREFRHKYEAGTFARFTNKRAAKDFVEQHKGKAELA